MKHLDEGTIHAWLDGALDAPEAREIQEHVDGCATCAEQVAEARGVIAGSSRILMALDDAPAGVTPKRASTLPVAPRRQWRAAPWVTGIAALFLGAVLLRTTRIERGPAVSPINIETPAQPAVTMDSARAPHLAPLAAPTLSVTPSREPFRPPTAARAGSGATVQRPIAAAQSARVAAPGARDERAVEAMVAIPPTPVPTTAVAEAAKLELMELEARRELQPSADSVSDSLAAWAGCYRVAGSRSLGDVLTTGAADVASIARARVATPSAPSAKAAYAAPLPPPTVRLDTVLRPLGYIVRAARSDSSIGWWREVGRDSARVDLLSRGVFTFARAYRVACP